VVERDIFHGQIKPSKNYEAARLSTVSRGVGQLQDIDENQDHKQYYFDTNYGRWQSVPEPSKGHVPYKSRIPLRKTGNMFSGTVMSPIFDPPDSVTDQDLVGKLFKEPHLHRGSPSNGLFQDEALARDHSTPSSEAVRPYRPINEAQINEVRPMRENVNHDNLERHSQHPMESSSPPLAVYEVARSQPAGSSGAAKRVVDFFRRLGKVREPSAMAVEVMGRPDPKDHRREHDSQY
jgi:hypothetical protein